MKTVFPSVTASKVSGVNSIALALAADSTARLTKNAIFLICLYMVSIKNIGPYDHEEQQFTQELVHR